MAITKRYSPFMRPLNWSVLAAGLSLLLGLTLATMPAHAAFDSKLTVKVTDSKLQKAGEARYRLLWKTITDAALYVDPQRAQPQEILDESYEKLLIIEYGLGVSKDRFVKMAKDTLSEHWNASDLENNARELELFYSWMQDVEKGDRYAVHWHPEKGFFLRMNGKPVGDWQNPEAAKIILSIWLGQAAVSQSQRDDILKQWQGSQ